MQTLRTTRTLRPSRTSLLFIQTIRMNSTATSEPPKKKKPSPYRIPKLDAFEETFGPLSRAGWRLAATSLSAANPAEGSNSVSDPLELEAKRLVHSYHFSDYAQLLEMTGELGRLVQDQDHHPTIVSGPSCDIADRPEGYTLRVSMLTHTPMPPLGTKLERKLSPGVTGKDLKLAQAIEDLWSGYKAP